MADPWNQSASEPAVHEPSDAYAVELDEVPVTPDRVQRFHHDRWYAKPFIVIGLVTALAGGLRFYHLSFPHAYVFDEVYYAKDGCYDAGFPYQQCHLDNPGEQTATVHPPLGRWIIAGSEAAFGNRSFGWRFGSAVAGTLSVLFLSILAYLLFDSVLWAGVAGLLLATESLNFVQSRISMLDIYLTAFVVLGFLCLVLDRRWIDRRTPTEPTEEDRESQELLGMPPDRPPSPVFRPWRIAAGLAFGAAASTKWSGWTALAGGILLAFVWECSRRRWIGLPNPVREALRDEGFGVFVFLVLLPAAVYLASYLRFWVDNGVDVQALSGWWSNQRGMANYSLHLKATHPYASHAWSWLLLKRPVAYYYQCVKTGTGSAGCAKPAEILGIGNPLIFWGSVFTVPYALWAWLRKHDWRAGLIVVAFSFQYFPWFAASRTSFLFYMAPITPFMVLAMTYATRDLAQARIGEDRVRSLAPVSVFIVVACVGVFAFFWPVLVGQTISYRGWLDRMWFSVCSPKATWCWI